MVIKFLKERTIYGLLATAVLMVVSISACNTKKDVQQEETASDTLSLQVDFTDVDTMQLIAGEQISKFVMPDEDKLALSEILSLSVSDTAWNNSGIMVKMVTPDYTLILQYKEKQPEDNSWLSIWKESGKLKFDDKWYFVNEDRKNELYSLLDRYKAE